MNRDADRARTWAGAGRVLLLFLAGAAAGVVWACGPFFPNSLLGAGDEAVLQAPAVSFERELARLELEPPPRLKPAVRDGTVDAEVLDLRRALGARNLASNEIAAVVLGYSRVRADLEEHRRAREAWVWALRDAPTNAPRPELRLSALPDGLPGEFVEYFRGAVAWHDGRIREARTAWEGLLARRAGERPFKSVWAAYMLGRSWHEEDPVKAEGWYERTRAMAKSGIPDTAGLGIASLGWQGQLRLRAGDLVGAMRFYADQYAAGGAGAELSLAVTAGRVLDAGRDQRLAVAGNPVFRRIVTAWVLAEYASAYSGWEEDPEGGREAGVSGRWLETIEAVGAAEVPLAEQMAVLAYQAGDWASADRWVGLSGDSAVAAWISAKLRLREGKLAESAALLSGVVRRLPLAESAPERPGRVPFVDSLRDREDGRPGRNQVLGEFGAVRMARGEFVGALDALLRAGYWADAAYVAERVLGVEELRRYVDAGWPALTGRAAEVEAAMEDGDGTLRGQRERIRYLLARRMTRSNRGMEAGPYFPREWRERQAAYLVRVREGADGARPARERARAWMSAAWLARTNGLEILGTEVGPDWAVWGGQFETEPTPGGRADFKGAKVLRPTRDELRRAAGHVPKPDERFHYRYVAARLAWEAARLLPDQDPETASILWTGGTWLKARDPKTADLFYKTLVRRCRKTALGDAADRLRWFPEVDGEGRPVTGADPGISGPPREVPGAGGTDLTEPREPALSDLVPGGYPDPARRP